MKRTDKFKTGSTWLRDQYTGRIAGCGMIEDNYGECSGNPDYEQLSRPQGLGGAGYTDEEWEKLNGPCIVAQEGKKK